MRESLSFGRHACRYMEQHLTNVDVVYANIWPLFGQAIVARYCKRAGLPLILHIQDIYPELLLKKLPGILREIAKVPLTALDRRTVQQAERIVVISENMRRTYVESRGLAPDKVVTVANWTDESRFDSLPSRADACTRYGVPEEKFTFLYLGNIGPMAGVEGLIEAFHAACLARAQLVIAGDGSAKVTCVQLVKRLDAKGVHFIPSPDVENVPLRQSLAHVCLLPLRKGAGMSAMPSKLPAYMFSAKPVLATVDAKSDTARCILAAQCGWVGEPENTEWLSKKMAEVASMPAEVLNKMGLSGREYGMTHFSKEQGVRRLSEIIVQGARQRS